MKRVVIVTVIAVINLITAGILSFTAIRHSSGEPLIFTLAIASLAGVLLLTAAVWILLFKLKQQEQRSRHRQQEVSHFKDDVKPMLHQFESFLEVGDLVDLEDRRTEMKSDSYKLFLSLTGEADRQRDLVRKIIDEMQLGLMEVQEQKEFLETLNQELTLIDIHIDKVVNVIGSVKRGMDSAGSVSEGLSRSMRQGRTLLEESIRKISGLFKSLSSVENFIGIVEDISSRTNLLAMNAAVQAARAGAHGKQFSVVATEIRKLSEIVHGHTQNMSGVVKGINQTIKDTETAVTRTNNQFDQLFHQSDEMVSIIGKSTETFAVELNEMDLISTNVASIKQMTASIEDGTENLDQFNQTLYGELGRIRDSSAASSGILERLQKDVHVILETGDEFNSRFLSKKHGVESLRNIIRICQNSLVEME